MIKINNVSISYGSHVAVEGVSCHLQEKGLYAIIGPNGAGKSTLLKALTGMLPVTEGHITLPKNMHKAYLPQQSSIDRTFPICVFDTVAMGMWEKIGPFGGYPSDAAQQVWNALNEVGMASYIKRPIGALSGGQFQKILFARICLQNADLIFLDEPFNNLDEPTVEDLIQIIVKWHQAGKTIVTVLHDLDIVKSLFPQTLLLAKSLVAYGPTKTILTVENIQKCYRFARQWGVHNE